MTTASAYWGKDSFEFAWTLGGQIFQRFIHSLLLCGHVDCGAATCETQAGN
jgi:hypothetical protein